MRREALRTALLGLCCVGVAVQQCLNHLINFVSWSQRRKQNQIESAQASGCRERTQALRLWPRRLRVYVERLNFE